MTSDHRPEVARHRPTGHNSAGHNSTGHRSAGPTAEAAGASRPTRGPRHAAPHPRRSTRAFRVAVLLALAMIGASGLALASWHASGVGAGSATTGTVTALTLTPGTPAASLYPGGRADVVLTVSNPNGSAVTVASLALDPTQGTAGFAVDAPHAACGTTSLGFTTQTNAGSGWTVPAKTGSVDGSLAVNLSQALSMTASAANSCQGAQFTVYLVAGP